MGIPGIEQLEANQIIEKIDPVKFNNDFRKATSFKEIDTDLVILEDPLNFKQELSDGTIETYMEKLARARLESGKNEAASYGIGTVGKQNFVGIIFNWEFMGGSAGVVVGEKMRRSVKLAEEKNLPLVALFSSGGQRQQEGAAAVREMRKTARAIALYKRHTKKPFISVLVSDVWGGISASAATYGEPVIGITGSNFGFSGRSDTEIVPNQTVERAWSTTRQVDVILNNQKELLAYLGKYLSIINEVGRPSHKAKEHAEVTGLDFDSEGFITPLEIPKPSLLSNVLRRADFRFFHKSIQPENVYEWYRHILQSDPRRPDTIYTLLHAFDSFIPFFSGRVISNGSGKYLIYPAIIAALAYIDDPRLNHRLTKLVIGNQPSYYKNDRNKETITRYPARPTAWDFRHEAAFFRYAKRFGYQILTIVDQGGSSVTKDDYEAAQYAAMAEVLEEQANFPNSTMVIDANASISGGGQATGAYGDLIIKFQHSHEYVAPPDTAARIIDRNATKADGPKVAEKIKPDAASLSDLGLIVDGIVEEPEGGAQTDPREVIKRIRELLIHHEISGGGDLTEEELEKRRDQRIKDEAPFRIGHLSDLGVKLKPKHPHRAAIKRLFIPHH